MSRITSFLLVTGALLALSACGLLSRSIPNTGETSAVRLVVQTQDGKSTFQQLGEIILYNYMVTNTETAPLAGPVTVVDGPREVICPAVDTVGDLDNHLDQDETITCTASYAITLEDLRHVSLENRAVAIVGGVSSNQSGVTLQADLDFVPLTGLSSPTPLAGTTTPSTIVPVPSSIMNRGSTIQHQVSEGEWLSQIARCYGANLEAVQLANPQISEPAALLSPSTFVTVPNAGSTGIVYGPPCVIFHTVQPGDTWTGIAQRYNADIATLQEANGGADLFNGQVLRVPINSARVSSGGYSPPPSGAFLIPATTGGEDPSIPIEIPAGTTTVLKDGSVAAYGIVRYRLEASEGQVLSLQLRAPANELALGVDTAEGVVLKPIGSEPIWSGTIPTTGSYRITVMNVGTASSTLYVLEVNLLMTFAGAGPSPEEISAREQFALSQLPQANFVYTAPSEIGLDEDFVIVLKLSPSASAREMTEQIVEEGGLIPNTADPQSFMSPEGAAVTMRANVVEITPYMQAVLTPGDRQAFEIQPLHVSAIQKTDPLGVTNWQWLITARKGGPQKLLLVIYRQVNSNDEEHWHMIQTYKADIRVNVTFSKWLSSLDWKWIAGVLVTALLIPGFWRWYDRPKKESEPPSKPAARKKKTN
jgi:LysM repeat protein